MEFQHRQSSNPDDRYTLAGMPVHEYKVTEFASFFRVLVLEYLGYRFASFASKLDTDGHQTTWGVVKTFSLYPNPEPSRYSDRALLDFEALDVLELLKPDGIDPEALRGYWRFS